MANGNINKTNFTKLNTSTIITKQHTYQIRNAINALINYSNNVDNCGNCTTSCQTCQTCQRCQKHTVKNCDYECSQLCNCNCNCDCGDGG